MEYLKGYITLRLAIKDYKNNKELYQAGIQSKVRTRTKYFCAPNEHPTDLDPLDPEYQTIETHPQEDNHLEVYVMYTKRNKAISPRPLLGVWHRVNLQTVSK